MDNKAFVRRLKKLGACQEAIDWVKKHGGTARECWKDCDNVDWKEWLLNHDNLVASREKIDKYFKARNAAWAKYLKALSAAGAKYLKTWAKYTKTCAATIRKYVPTIYEDK